MHFIFAIVSSLALAADGASLLKPYPRDVLKFEVVEFKPETNHHFSMEAPQKCGTANAGAKINARSVKCQYSQAGEVTATLNVCDDKKTFCKPINVQVQVLNREAKESARLLKNQDLNRDLKKQLVPGFVEGTVAEIKARAAKENKPVFLMISTDWCPPCNEAKEYLLTTGAFADATDGWLKVYVDGDSLAAARLGEAVPYRYYPTFVLLNSKFEEIARFNDELRESAIRTWAATERQRMDYPIAKLRERVMARLGGGLGVRFGDWWRGVSEDDHRADEARLLAWALDQENEAIIEVLLENRSFPELQARISAYKISRPGVEAKEKKRLLTELLDFQFQRDDWSESLSQLCELDVNACRNHAQRRDERIRFLSERSGLTPAERASALGEEHYYLADVFSQLKDEAGQRREANACVKSYDSLRQRSQLKLSRGAQQGIVACMELAGDFVAAERTLSALIEAYPKEPTFKQRLARTLKKQKKFEQALQWVLQAEDAAYGYNWFTLQAFKADLLLDLKRDKDALDAVNKALEEIALDENPESRNQLVLSRLRVLQAKAQGRGAASQ